MGLQQHCGTGFKLTTVPAENPLHTDPAPQPKPTPAPAPTPTNNGGGSMTGLLGGYDVSSYQPGINTAAIPGDFVIVKATEGTGYINPYFSAQINGADTGGKLIGAYHFLQPGNGARQAEYFNQTVKNYVGKAVLALDYESENGVKPSVADAKAFLDRLYALTGVRAFIYMGLADENQQNWSSIAPNYPLWVAQYNNYNPVYGYQPRDLYGSTKNWNGAKMFQYTSVGRLSGWNGNLDLNVFYGGAGAWRQLAKP